ncbi:MAG TPA: class I SAM-dependent methyltransferase, partial [Phototrophicaceae bacterium]|nr:class I SAM-dependent methyltransferase [Phototrophicaceae bacterium]
MAASDSNNQNLPNFNRRDEDKMALGHTPSTRSAELVAGARAILMNTPETTALGSMSGRIVARVLTETGGKSNILWFFPARMMAIETLTQQLMPNKSELLLVDVAAGFSPRGLHMAREYPQARVIEIDLPDVVAEKKLRLKRGRIPLPDNLSWIEADLGKVNLQDVLDGQQVD